jgi:hypothetical protein
MVDIVGFVSRASGVAGGCAILFRIPSCRNFLKSKQ